MWSSPVERAAQLKRQQKVLREQEWHAAPEYEKRRVVVSVDLVGGKVVRRMGEVGRPAEGNAEVVEDAGVADMGDSGINGGEAGGAFSKNPLLGGMIRPLWKGKGKSQEVDGGEEGDKENVSGKSAWRRVQDDNDDNEAWILDGGIYGGSENARKTG